MPMMAFFPWLRVGAEGEALGPFRLVRWRSRSPTRGEISQADSDVIRDVVRDYRIASQAPLDEVTVVLREGREVFDEWDESERARLFLLRELLTTAGLARREFFGCGEYWNSTHFVPVVQAFTLPVGGSVIGSRRRDGSAGTYETRGAYREYLPRHVRINSAVSIDRALLTAMIEAEEGCAPRDRDALCSAVSLFNLANTDEPMITELQELVLMASALEQLTKPDGSNEAAFASAIQQALAPSDGAGKAANAWAREFYRARNLAAHGQPMTPARLSRTPTEHLFLAAFCFPLVLQRWLQGRGRYAWTVEDGLKLKTFERILSHPEPMTGPANPPPYKELTWNLRRERTAERCAAMLEDLDPTDGPDESPES